MNEILSIAFGLFHLFVIILVLRLFRNAKGYDDDLRDATEQWEQLKKEHSKGNKQ